MQEKLPGIFQGLISRTDVDNIVMAAAEVQARVTVPHNTSDNAQATVASFEVAEQIFSAVKVVNVTESTAGTKYATLPTIVTDGRSSSGESASEYTSRILEDGGVIVVAADKLSFRSASAADGTAEPPQITPALRELVDAFNLMLGGINITAEFDSRWNAFDTELSRTRFRGRVSIYVSQQDDTAPYSVPNDQFLVQLDGRQTLSLCTPHPEDSDAVFFGTTPTAADLCELALQRRPESFIDGATQVVSYTR